ncbi:MAG: hypothetical protein D6815_08225 [Candidatus Dadabacteria bacterium]|nr:MAG: hypothetical protein D6815_08225 [Candidatus Dadabacteria bacterium]
MLGRDAEAYHVRACAGGGFEANNPAHSLRAVFRVGGVELFARGETWLLRWVGQASAGRRSTPEIQRKAGAASLASESGAAEPIAERNRVEYRHEGVTEWYENGPLGLEQGFTVKERPTREPLRLELEQGGTLRPEIAKGGRELVLHGSDGAPVLLNSGLVAWDATGRRLPARLELSKRTLVIEVDDTDAEYPVTVDPFVQLAKLLASDGRGGDTFGWSVAVSGDTVVIGAPLKNIAGNSAQGAAYVFVRPPTGWADMTETAKLVASDGAPADGFGMSVAIDADTVVVGAPTSDVGGNIDQGSAYVFVKPSGGWAGTLTESAKLVASDGASYDQLGNSVAISGDTVIAGAIGDDVGANSDQGSVYVFVKPAGGWTGTLVESAKLTASDGMPYDGFGASVAMFWGGRRGRRSLGRCWRKRQPGLRIRLCQATGGLGGHERNGKACGIRRCDGR